MKYESTLLGQDAESLAVGLFNRRSWIQILSVFFFFFFFLVFFSSSLFIIYVF